ncbi:hypothetical protein I3843_02G036900 [Carya illinoinensis]|nr:hypothetical protein I3843_02G036900 [Carya illinoinensis]
MMSKNCPEVGDVGSEAEIVIENENENVEKECDVDVDVEERGNVISSSNSGPLEPFIGMKFDDTKIGCKAIIAIRKDGEQWAVTKFVPKHNHELLTPRSTSLLRGHRGVTRAQKKLILTLNEFSVPIRNIMSVLSKESSSDFNVGCIGQDVETFLGNKRRKLFEEGDAQRLYAYLFDRQCKEPGFVYSMQVDENGCMGSCFWADAMSRAAYQYFGDVVTFDATYLTNIYKMPCVSFSGVNYHHQTIMFGCAILVNETAESYTWLLRTWQEAMFGKAPKTIIIDNDKAMAKAIVEYGLIDNTWLQNLYNRQEMWVPTYLRSTFCARMSTTQRSESMNKFFKDYVYSSTMVSDFVHQYEKVLDARYFKEKEKDVRTISTRAILKTGYKIEEEAALVYTRKSFMKFQDELFSSQQYKSTKFQSDSESKTYEVTPQCKETSVYYFMGIICRHILCVFGKKFKLDMLPWQYILERWTVNAKSRAILEIPTFEAHVTTQDDSTMRKSKLAMQFYEILELGSQSIQKFNHLSLALDKVHKELLLIEDG